MLVSVHIPKTGGVTLRRSVLEPAFGDRLLLDYEDAPLSHGADERNERARAYEPDSDVSEQYDCVHGHFLAIKYVSDRMACRFAVWLRDPVQWVVSRFHHGKRSAGGLVTPEMTLAEFCDLDRFHNVYAQYLWGFDLRRFDFVGITEDYEKSVAIFRNQFGLPEAGVVPVNVNPGKDPAERYRLSKDLRDLIRRRNREDFEIYRHARAMNERLQRDYLRSS